ncbi:MAG: large repetitive protein, partial [Thermoleophilaceae bacterium]|nr:large repetitive protein [Thermoleophilaceae bacterium]
MIRRLRPATTRGEVEGTRSMTRLSRRPALVSAVLSLALLALAPVAAADNPVDISPTEGQAFTGRIATTNCATTSSSIDWGDGAPASPGRDAGTPPGVAGDHTYAEEGTYNGTVTYTSTCIRFATLHFTATVADAPLSVSGRDISAAQGQELSGAVAHFTDSDPGGTAGDYSATIQWGDGSSSAGTVTAAGGGGFDVAGTHVYASAGSYTVSVSVVDSGGATASGTGNAAISSTASEPPPPPASSPPSPPSVVSVDAPGPPAAGKPIVLTAVTDGTTSSIEWNLTGDSRPEVTCSGAQTAVTFRAPAGNHTVTVVAAGPGGKGSPFTKSFDVAPAAPLTAAQQTVAGKVTNALAKKPPVYACASPDDFAPTRVKGSSTLTDKIAIRQCVTPKT